MALVVKKIRPSPRTANWPKISLHLCVVEGTHKQAKLHIGFIAMGLASCKAV